MADDTTVIGETGLANPGRRLRELVASDTLVVAPGAFDPFVGRIIQREGFPAIYAGGSAISNANFGRPDMGLSTMTEVRDIARNIAAAVDIPVLGDIDQGFGDLLNVRRSVREFEAAGLAGVHMEDEGGPSKDARGQLPVSTERMVEKLTVALEARRDPEFMVWARCDAMPTLGLDDAIARGHAYAEAGADGLWMFAPGASTEEVERIARELTEVPLIYNMTVRGTGPAFTLSRLEDLGFSMVIIPNLLFFGMTREASRILRELTSTGSIADLAASAATPQEMEALNGMVFAHQFQLRHPQR